MSEKGAPETGDFDPQYKFVTSYLFSPAILAGLRFIFAIFILVTAIYTLVWQAVQPDGSADGCVERQ